MPAYCVSKSEIPHMNIIYILINIQNYIELINMNILFIISMYI